MDAFVGRTKQTRELTHRLRDRPVTVLLGRGGIGKTATARRVLASFERSVELAVRPRDDLRQVLLSLMRALSRTMAPASLGDIDVLLRDVMTSSETCDAVVFVDDLHHLSAEDARTFVLGVARDARHRRFLLAARTLSPIPEVLEHVVTLDDLDEKSLVAIARQAVPKLSLAESRKLAHAAQGSPWLLRHAAWTKRDAPPEPSEILEALPRATASIVRLLGALDLPITEATLRSLTGGTRGGRSSRVDLERAGVEMHGSTIRLHDVLRDLLRVGSTERTEVTSLGDAACAQGDARGVLEAVRLHLEVGRTNEAASLLRRGFDLVVDGGLAPRMYALLANERAPELSAPRLRSALALGAGAPLDDVIREPRVATTESRVCLAEAYLLVGRYGDAESLLESLLEALAEGDDAFRTDAMLVLARTQLLLGSIARATTLLDRVPVDDVAAGARASALRARARIAAADHAAALVLADELGKMVNSLPTGARREVQHARLFVYSTTGRLTQVRQIAEGLFGLPSRGSSMLEGLGAVVALSLLEVEGCRLIEARRLLSLLEPYTGQVASLRFFHDLSLARVHTIEGDFAAVEQLVSGVIAAARQFGDRNAELWGLASRSLLFVHEATDVTNPELLAQEIADGAKDVDGPHVRFARSFQVIRALRSGRHVAIDRAPNEAGDDTIGALVFGLLGEATRSFLAGRVAEAEESARRAISLGEKHGYRAHALEGRLLLAEMLVVRRKRPAAIAALVPIEAAAESIPSRRYADEATILRAILDEASPSITMLEGIASHPRRAPAAARRARALLGIEGPLDAIDRRVVEARTSTTQVQSGNVTLDPSAPSWGIDLVEGRIWFPDGTSTEVRGETHGRILLTLAEQRGVASKEELARSVWGVTSYHRLRDDKRIQVAVLRLRRVIERNPERPTRVLMTANGYAFGTTEPMRVRANRRPSRDA